MKNKICIVVRGNTIDEFILSLDVAQKKSNLVELRVDYIEKLTKGDIDKIKNILNVEAIFTLRSNFEGGRFNGTLQEKENLISYADKLGFDYIDVEYKLIDKIKLEQLNTRKIISFHDFNQTPLYGELIKIKEKVYQHSDKNILKIATQVNLQKDLNNLYRLLINKKQEENMVIIGMGEKGVKSRIIAPLLGSFLSFVSSSENQKTAPGQIDIVKMKKIFNIIESI